MNNAEVMNVCPDSSLLHFRVVMIGAGRVASHLAPALASQGVQFCQVYSRTAEAAEALAEVIAAANHSLSKPEAIHQMDALTREADLYLVSLTDQALLSLLPQLVSGREQALWVHTAGSVPLSCFQGLTLRGGVLYPMQTFSKGVPVEFSLVSLFVEASLPADLLLLERLAALLTTHVHRADSRQRKALHIGAVMACNFANHAYALAQYWLEQQGLPFEAMLPLIDETARKVHQLKPMEGQTGPAIRQDQAVMASHIELLHDYPQLQAIYRQLSQSIIDLEKTKSNQD